MNTMISHANATRARRRRATLAAATAIQKPPKAMSREVQRERASMLAAQLAATASSRRARANQDSNLRFHQGTYI
jgi:hypothetical protein